MKDSRLSPMDKMLSNSTAPRNDGGFGERPGQAAQGCIMRVLVSDKGNPFKEMQ